MKPIRQLLLLSLVILTSLALVPAAFGAPSITGLSPVAAPVGALVTITGTNFGMTQGTSTVTFNGTVATVIVGWSDTSIVATVPRGATTGNVVVTVSGAASIGVSFMVGIDIEIKRVVPFGAQTSGGRIQITNVTAWVTLDSASLGLKFTSPDTFATSTAKVWTVTLTPAMPPASCPLDSTAVACHDFPVPTLLSQGPNPICPTACADNITIVPHSSGTTGPLQFEIRFALLSNYNVGPGPTQPPTARCSSTQTQAPEHYTIEVTTGTPLTGTCVESYDKTLNNCLSNNPMQLQLLPPDEVFVVGPPKPTVACGKDRPAVDVVMVLDKSGSMLTPLTPAQGAFCPILTGNRMDALGCAAKRFLDLWDPSPTDINAPAISQDRVGVVSFSTTALTNANLAAVSPGNVATKTAITNVMNTVGGSTSIGAGLLEADSKFAGTTNRKVVLLMTDGQQNTDPKVTVTNLATRTAGLYCDNVADPLCTIPTCTLPGNSCPLSNNPQIYTVTLGPSTGVSQAIDQDIANASLGFYLHTDTDGDLLSPFFLELLQNFLKFNSYDTVRMISDKASEVSYSADVPIATTSRDVEFSLMWPKDLGALRMTVTPPGGAPAIVKGDPSGFIVIIQSLPLPPRFDPMGNWHIEVEAIDLASGITTAGANAGSIPFDLHIMTDDAGVKSDLSVVPGDYKTGDNIRLRAKLRYFGLPILGLGSHPGDTIKVDLLKPGQGVGDMLSDSTASSTPPRADIDPGAEAKLFNAVQSTPLGVVRQPDITLFDDGKPEHGDDVAGDGIYSALSLATLPGDYNFVFSVESTDPNSVRFSRQQLRAAYVRAVPDDGNTVFQTSIVRRDAGKTLSIVMTPRVKPGPGCLKTDPKCGRMGPGWANYFWFVTPGKPPFKATDNLNGTYTATLSFTGSNPPPVDVHFENVLAVIGDSVTPDHLPDPLGPGNVFVKDCCRQAGRVAVFFDLGAGIPHGTFGSAFNTGFSLNTGLEYIATSHFSVEGIFGYHHFPGKIAGDLNLYQFSANGKAYLTSGTLRPFINGGIGAYKFSPGPTKFGGNVGAGLLYSVTSQVGVQGSYNFHIVNTPGVATKFSALQAGIRFVF